MEILETKGRKMNKIKREEREDLHTFSDTTSPIFYRGLICVLLNQISLKKECKGFPFTFTLFAVGMTGLEPATTGPPDQHSKPTELHPV